VFFVFWGSNKIFAAFPSASLTVCFTRESSKSIFFSLSSFHNNSISHRKSERETNFVAAAVAVQLEEQDGRMEKWAKVNRVKGGEVKRRVDKVF